MKLGIAVAILASSLWIGAKDCTVPPSPPPQPVDDGGTGTGGSSGVGGSTADPCANPMDECLAAECTLARLRCAEAKSPNGTPFSEACRRARVDSRDWRPDCLARITSCSQISAAYRVKAGASCPQ
jgi:hypothetical protein